MKYRIKIRQALLIVLALSSTLNAVPGYALDEQSLRQDWAQLKRYAKANADLPVSNASEKRVVFYGDSITDSWSLIESFPNQPYVNRGISGQTTPQMLVRFRQDVIDLKPGAVVILAGTNDLAENTGPETQEQIEGYLTSMCELARANNIRVILASVLPAVGYSWRPNVQPAARIRELNEWLRLYAKKNNHIYLDYYSAMVDTDYGLPKSLSKDGVHPNKAGYALMAPLLQKAVTAAFRN